MNDIPTYYVSDFAIVKVDKEPFADAYYFPMIKQIGVEKGTPFWSLSELLDMAGIKDGIDLTPGLKFINRIFAKIKSRVIHEKIIVYLHGKKVVYPEDKSCDPLKELFQMALSEVKNFDDYYLNWISFKVTTFDNGSPYLTTVTNDYTVLEWLKTFDKDDDIVLKDFYPIEPEFMSIREVLSLENYKRIKDKCISKYVICISDPDVDHSTRYYYGASLLDGIKYRLVYKNHRERAALFLSEQQALKTMLEACQGNISCWIEEYTAGWPSDIPESPYYKELRQIRSSF